MNTLTFASTTVTSYLAASEQAARQREVDNALLVQALCERQPSTNVVARMKRYVSGELSREQAFAELYMGTY
ncbi:MAG: antitoxin VbhA family protein [Janthinobacterium lividum]